MMILKNTFHIDEDIHEAGLEYIKNTYIKSAIASGILYEPILLRVYVQYEEVGASYTAQFRVKDKKTLDEWVATEGGALQKAMFREFGDKIASFITLKKRIQL